MLRRIYFTIEVVLVCIAFSIGYYGYEIVFAPMVP